MGKREEFTAAAAPSTNAATPAISASTGWAALCSGANGLRSLALAGGVALHAMSVYVVATVLPSVVRDIGGLDLYSWSTAIFIVASIAGSALAAGLLKRLGPRRAYALSALVFATGAALCALAPAMPVLLAGRLVQGFGGGVLCALAYSMIRVVFDEALWPRAMALVSGMWGVATLIGPAVGGVFAEWGMWRASFWSVAGAATAFALLAAAVLPRNAASTSASAAAQGNTATPKPQLGLLIAVVLAVSAGSASTDPAWNLAGIVLAIGCAALLVRIERRASNRLLPSGAFRPGSPVAKCYAILALLSLTVTSAEIFAPLFLQVLHRQPPLAAGYLAALMGAGWTLGALACSGASGPNLRRLIVAGPLLELAGMLGLFALLPRDSGGEWLALLPICTAMVALGLGVGVAWPHLLTRALKAVPDAENALAGASITTVQLFATAAGAALVGMLANAGGLVEPGGVAGTAQAARWVFGALLLAPLGAALIARRAA
ncbi:MFS transporter [Burkholderia sp. 22PA0106]